MAHQKAPVGPARPFPRASLTASRSRAGGAGAAAALEGGFTEVDREVVEALAGFRDALRDRVPLETRYTVRQVVVVEPPPPLTPAEVRGIRESLGLSQPVFADFLGAFAVDDPFLGAGPEATQPDGPTIPRAHRRGPAVLEEPAPLDGPDPRRRAPQVGRERGVMPSGRPLRPGSPQPSESGKCGDGLHPGDQPADRGIRAISNQVGIKVPACFAPVTRTLGIAPSCADREDRAGWNSGAVIPSDHDRPGRAPGRPARGRPAWAMGAARGLRPPAPVASSARRAGNGGAARPG